MLLFCSVELLCIKVNADRKRNQKTFYLPDMPKRWLDESYSVPSEKFCAEVQIKPADHYFLLPWWFHYCQKLQETRAKTLKNSVFTNMPLYKKVLEKVKKFKQQVRHNPVEIPAYRDFDVGARKHQSIAVYRPMARRALHINRGQQLPFLEHQ